MKKRMAKNNDDKGKCLYLKTDFKLWCTTQNGQHKIKYTTSFDIF